jgi:hypothetical protein
MKYLLLLFFCLEILVFGVLAFTIPTRTRPKPTPTITPTPTPNEKTTPTPPSTS